MPFALQNIDEVGIKRPHYGVRETVTGLLVWADESAPLATAAALVRFLTDCAGHLTAHEVRAMLAPCSDLPAVPDVEERAS